MNREETFAYLRANKRLLIAEKKAAIKYADGVHTVYFTEQSDGALKAFTGNPEIIDMDKFNLKVVINTTNLMDSHDDVHFPGIWNKSLKENKSIYLLQEHQMRFDKVISDEVQAKAVTMAWSELGYKYEGFTQALIFDAAVEKDRNPFMAEQYAKGRVKNHSVGMRYMKIDLAMNSESQYDKEEKKIWDKYISQVVNREQAEEKGYFWAVTEAKVIEGSAVLMGSNYATPTISAGKEPPVTQENEPTQSTQQKARNIFDY